MIAFNAFSQLLALGSILVIQTGYMIIAARFLGPEDFGRYSFVWSVIQILLIGGDLGLHNTALRRISSDLKRSEDIAKPFFLLKLIVSLLLFLIVAALAMVIKETGETRVSLVIFGSGLVLHCMCLACNIVFQAHGKLYFASFNVFLIFAVKAAIGITALLLGGRLLWLALAYLIATLIGLVTSLWLFRRNVHPITLGRSSNWKEMARESAPIGLATFFSAFSDRLAVTLLTFLSGPFQTGIYSAALRIPLSLGNIPASVTSAVLPEMASRQGDSQSVRRLFKKTVFLLSAVSIPLALFFFFFAPPVVNLIYGPEYAPSIEVLRILTWLVIPLFLSRALSSVLMSQTKLVPKLPWITGLGLMVNFAMSYILITRFDSVGAAIGMLVTEGVLVVGYYLGISRFLFSRVRPED